jgi:hypothetical protein
VVVAGLSVCLSVGLGYAGREAVSEDRTWGGDVDERATDVRALSPTPTHSHTPCPYAYTLTAQRTDTRRHSLLIMIMILAARAIVG